MFDMDDGGDPLIQTVDTTDSSVAHGPHTLIVRRSRDARTVAYFKADPRQTSFNHYSYLVVEYLDRGRGHWFVEYDRADARDDVLHPWTTSVLVPLDDTGEWRRIALPVTVRHWTGSLGNADFRIVVVDQDSDEFVIRDLALAMDSSGAAVLGEHESEPEVSSPPRFKFIRPSRFPPICLPQAAAPSASIIIPVYNRLAYTRDCLRAIMEFTPPLYEVIVVDDGSSDGTARELETVPGLRVVRSSTNQGFARACNAGGAAASGEWLVFLNNDTVAQPGWLTAMIAVVERDSRVAVVGSRLIFPQTGTIQHAGVSFGPSRLPRHDYEHADADDEAINVDREVDAVTGACLLTAREWFLRTGGFDERFVNGFEDIDLCLRAKQEERQVMYCSKSTLLHYKSVSTGRLDRRVDSANITLFRRKWDKFIRDRLETSSAKGPRPRGRNVRRRSVAGLRLDRDRLPQHIGIDPELILSQTGEMNNGRVTCRSGRHPQGHCVYGGYAEVSEALTAKAGFLIEIPSSRGGGGYAATFDVYDCIAGKVLVRGVLKDPGEPRRLSRCSIEFSARAGQVLEFRVFWHGNCDLAVAGIDVTAA